MHTGQPNGKQGIELLCICNCYECQSLVVAASGNHPLLNSVTALVDQSWYKLNDTVKQWEADQCRHERGCAYFGQCLVAAASSSVRWCHCTRTLVNLLLLSAASNSISTFWSRMCAAVDCIPERYRQNWDSNLTLHDYLLPFPLANYCLS